MPLAKLLNPDVQTASSQQRWPKLYKALILAGVVPTWPFIIRQCQLTSSPESKPTFPGLSSSMQTSTALPSAGLTLQGLLYLAP